MNAQGRLQGGQGAALQSLVAFLDQRGARARRLHQVPDQALEAMTAQARARAGSAPDLASWYRLSVPPGTDVAGLVRDLQSRPEVEFVYPAPLGAPPPFTPDFTASQLNYLGPAPSGTEAVWARSQPGGRGANVTIVDMEYMWQLTHEDLQFPPSIMIAGSVYDYYGPSHGTSVLGEIAARDNGFGVTGAVPDATVRVAGLYVLSFYAPATTLTMVSNQLSAGDVILLEAQTEGPGGSTDLVPVEYIRSVYDAILVATANGRIVVEAAGNKDTFGTGVSLDPPAYSSYFNRAIYDSRAIMVGAGNNANARICCNWGQRVDLQGHGSGVTTLGDHGAPIIPPLFGTTMDDFYTGVFSGTSSASPIVASAAVAIQSRQKYYGRPVLTPTTMRALLQATGSSQTGNLAQNIGRKPNLISAFAQLDAMAVNAVLNSVSTSPVPPRQYQPFTLTLNGSGFNVNYVEVVYSMRCLPPGSWCSTVLTNSEITTKTPTQLIKSNWVFGTADTVKLRVRNSSTGALSAEKIIVIAPMY